MNYGITSTGFNAKTYSVLLRELEELWVESFGAVDTAPDGALGQIARSITLPHAELWQLFQGIYNNSDVRNAGGQYLDRLASIVGIQRLASTKATAVVYVGGTIGTVIPQGSQVRQGSSNRVYSTDSAITISQTNCNKFEFKVPSVVIQGTSYGFKLKAISIYYTAVSGDDTKRVITQLKNILRSRIVECDVSTIEDNSTNDGIVVTSRIPYSPFTVSDATGGTVVKVWNFVSVTANLIGANVAQANSINSIVSPIAGWSDVYNPIAGSSGSDQESDEDLRKRMKRATQIGSNSTEYAIESKIWNNVPNVSNVLVYSNRTDSKDIFGNDPRSVRVVVEGGSSEAIAQQLYNSLPCGIPTSGEVSHTLDQAFTGVSGGVTIKFSRTKTLFGWVKVTVNERNPEETYPSNAKELIRNAIFLEAIRGINLGSDIIAQKFIGAIYRSVSGIANVTVEVAVTGSNDVNIVGIPSGDYASTTPSYSSGWMNRVIGAPTDKVEWRDANNETRIIIND